MSCFCRENSTSNMFCLELHLCGEYLVTEADSQLFERYRMRTVGTEEDLELNGLINMETGTLELGLTLN